MNFFIGRREEKEGDFHSPCEVKLEKSQRTCRNVPLIEFEL